VGRYADFSLVLRSRWFSAILPTRRLVSPSSSPLGSFVLSTRTASSARWRCCSTWSPPSTILGTRIYPSKLLSPGFLLYCWGSLVLSSPHWFLDGESVCPSLLLFARIFPSPLFRHPLTLSRFFSTRAFTLGLSTNLSTLATLFETLISLYLTPHEQDMKRLHYQVLADLLFNAMRENVALTREVKRIT